MSYKNVKISEAMEYVEQLLKDAVAQLPDREKVDVERPGTIEGYRLSHGRGSFLIVPGKGTLDNKEFPNTIIQDHDMMIYVYPVIKYISGRNEPADYVDFVMDTLTGVEIQPAEGSKRADRQMYATDWTVVKEEHGEWWFLVGVVLPYSRFEKEYLQNQ